MKVKKLRPCAQRQHGLAALAVTLLLGLASLLALIQTHRSIATESRASVNQVRSSQAFEAAEAGIEWAIAKLNDDAAIGVDCLPLASSSTTSGAMSFRDAHLRYDAALRQHVAATWDDAGATRPLAAACRRSASGWNCTCPSNGAAGTPAASGNDVAPAFRVSLRSGDSAALVRVVSYGCTDAATACVGDIDPGADHEAAARVELLVALLPGLRSEPVAAMTVRGDVDAFGAGLGARNDDPGSGGLALHAGGRVIGNALRLTSSPGSSLAASIVGGDAALAGSSADRFFARWFGMTQDAWAHQPGATRIACASGCAAALIAAVGAGHRMVAIEGDLALDGPITLGEPNRPVIVVVSGAARLGGAVVVHGVFHGASIHWGGSAGGAVIGAALTPGNYTGSTGSAGPDFIRDAATLARLRYGTGSFVRVAGSWKDF